MQEQKVVHVAFDASRVGNKQRMFGMASCGNVVAYLPPQALCVAAQRNFLQECFDEQPYRVEHKGIFCPNGSCKPRFLNQSLGFTGSTKEFWKRVWGVLETPLGM